MFGIVPKNWWKYHSKGCGTNFRGCAPDCPKDIYERTKKWTGPNRIQVFMSVVKQAFAELFE